MNRLNAVLFRAEFLGTFEYTEPDSDRGAAVFDRIDTIRHTAFSARPDTGIQIQHKSRCFHEKWDTTALFRHLHATHTPFTSLEDGQCS